MTLTFVIQIPEVGAALIDAAVGCTTVEERALAPDLEFK